MTINRPEAKNAVDPETHELLWRTWEDFRDDDAVDVAILTGAGDAFCAGFLYGLSEGRDRRAAAELGCAVAARVAEGLGTDAGGLPIDA